MTLALLVMVSLIASLLVTVIDRAHGDQEPGNIIHADALDRS